MKWNPFKGKDRNAEAVEAARRSSAAAAIADGRIQARDRYGKPITAGALVLMLPVDPGTVFVVEDVKPMLDPRAPVGAVELVVSCRLQVRTVAGQPANGLAVVGQLEAAKPAAPSPDLANIEGERGEQRPPANGPSLVLP